jgi:phosphoribosyl-ATP pyrophosphohydrolase
LKQIIATYEKMKDESSLNLIQKWRQQVYHSCLKVKQQELQIQDLSSQLKSQVEVQKDRNSKLADENHLLQQKLKSFEAA